MTAARHTWMLRHPATAFDFHGTLHGALPCRLCRVQDKHVMVDAEQQDAHLAYHRGESVVREPPRTDFLQECE